MTYDFTRTGPQIQAIHDTVSDPSTNESFTDSIGKIVVAKYSDLAFDSISTAISEIINNNYPVGTMLRVDDYYGGASPNNSGVLFFKIVAGGTGAADGGKYIDAGSFQLEQNFKLPISVKAYGAKGDGASGGDYQAIQNASDYSPILHFPSGIYDTTGNKITSTRDSMRWTGDSGNGFASQNTLIRNTTSASGEIAEFGSSTETTARGIQMFNIAWQTSQGSALGGIRIRRSNHCRFENCGFSFFDAAAAVKFFSDGDGCIVPMFIGCTFRKNQFHIDGDTSGGGVNTSLQIFGGYFDGGLIANGVGVRYGETMSIIGAAFDSHVKAISSTGDGDLVSGCRFEFNTNAVSCDLGSRKRIVNNFFAHDFGATPNTIAVNVASTSGGDLTILGNSYQGYVDNNIIDPSYPNTLQIVIDDQTSYRKRARTSGAKNTYLLENNFPDIGADAEYLGSVGDGSIIGGVKVVNKSFPDGGVEIATETSHDIKFITNNVEAMRVHRGNRTLDFPNGASFGGVSGNPEGNVTANPGSIRMSDNGNVYKKNSGTGNTGWSAL